MDKSNIHRVSMNIMVNHNRNLSDDISVKDDVSKKVDRKVNLSDDISTSDSGN